METQTENTKSVKQPRRTASRVFQELIMTNDGKTDLEIFKEVQKEFGVDKIPDRHANYVGWYRGYLRKNGKNPPPAVKPAKVAKTATTKAEKTVESAATVAEKPTNVHPITKKSKSPKK